MSLDDAVQRSAAELRQRCPGPAPEIAVLLGSGWGPMADRVRDGVDIAYGDLPAFPVLGVGGHAGRLRCGSIGNRRVAVLAGRKHAYETGDADGMKGAIRSLAAWGVTLLVQTNAAGSLDPAMRPGQLMLIADHLNLVQRSPLFHDTGDRRFVDMANAYDPALRRQALAVASAQGVTLHEGVYAWCMGPQFETPAEIRMLRGFGVQAVGMSTVPETILARQAGLRVLAVSLLTNMAAGLSDESLSHTHTLTTAQAAAQQAVGYLNALLESIQL